jgi:hypothetical protein
VQFSSLLRAAWRSPERADGISIDSSYCPRHTVRRFVQLYPCATISELPKKKIDEFSGVGEAALQGFNREPAAFDDPFG